MKVLAIVLLCAFAVAVQGRSAVKVVDNSSSELALENQKWLVHLRYAIRTSGFLETAVGTLISTRWVCTTSNTNTASFIWIRLGVVNVLQPSLVIESSAVRSQGLIGLVNLNTDIQISASIAPISLVQWSGPVSGQSFGFGLSAVGGPGEILQSSEIDLEESEDGILIGSKGILSQFDLGTALVKSGSQYGVLIAVDESSASFAVLDDVLKQWLQQETGVEVEEVDSSKPNPDSSEPNPDSSEPNPDSSESNPDSSEPNPDSSEPNPDSSEPNPDSSESNSSSSESNASSSESNSSSSESKEGSRVKVVNF